MRRLVLLLVCCAAIGIGTVTTAGAIAVQPTIYLPVAPGLTVWAGGPHGSSVRNAVDIGRGDDQLMGVFAAFGGVMHEYDAQGFVGCEVFVTRGAWSMFYSHLTKVYPSLEGKTIATGSRIGVDGQPGTETCGDGSPNFRHVHVELFHNDQPVAMDGVSIGGYTVHQAGDNYCGSWTRNGDGVTVESGCGAGPQLVNDRVLPAAKIRSHGWHQRPIRTTDRGTS